MKALIATNEPRQTGYRVAQVEQDADIFPVSVELFWADCPDTTVADQVWYDPADQSYKEFPPPPTPAPNPDQPATTGTQPL